MEEPSADEQHIAALLDGKRSWRQWRRAHPDVRPSLCGVRAVGLDFENIDLSGADLAGADLSQSNLRRAKLVGSDLTAVQARFTRFSEVKAMGATLVDADLRAASFRRGNLTGADLSGAIMRFTSLAGATVEGATFSGAEVFGLGAWNLIGEPAAQDGLLIREKEGATTTTVDDLETAQLLFLLRENDKIADVIETASRRTVLLLGRFKGHYGKVLEGLRDHLLARNFVPVLFDFARPPGRDLTETVASLAHMACFVVPDLSGAKSVPQELSHIVPFLPSVPVVPILAEREERVYSMFEHFRRYPWVHAPVRYRDLDHLLAIVDDEVIRVGFDAAMRARGEPDAELPQPPPMRRSRRR